MSLLSLSNVNTNTVDVFLVFSDVELLLYEVRAIIEEKFNVSRDFVMPCNSAKALTQARGIMQIKPLEGERWLILIDLDRIGAADVAKSLAYGGANCVTMIFSKSYKFYKNLTNSEEYRKYSKTIMPVYLRNFVVDDIVYLHKKMVCDAKHTKPLTDDLLNYIIKNYRYDVKKVLDLFSKMRNGLVLETKADIIAEIGLGGVTADSFIMDLLRVGQPPTGRFGQFKPQPRKTEQTEAQKKATKARTVKARSKKFMILLHDLSTRTKYYTLFTQMQNTLINILAYKALILDGRIRRGVKDLTEEEEQAVKRLSRFSYVIQDEISTSRVMFLLTLFTSETSNGANVNEYTTPDYEAKLMRIVLNYISTWED